MKVQTYQEFNFHAPVAYWSTFASSGPTLFQNGALQGLDYNDMTPSFDLGLTSHKDHEYLHADINMLTYSIVAWIFVLNVQGSYPLFSTQDANVSSKTGLGDPRYCVQT